MYFFSDFVIFRFYFNFFFKISLQNLPDASLFPLVAIIDTMHTIKYEIAICPNTNRIVWIYGGTGGGLFHDRSLADIGFFAQLVEGQYVLGDKGYQGANQCLTPIKGTDLDDVERKFNKNLGTLRISVERVIGQFKKFQCLSHPWRHSRKTHQFVFGVIAEMVNIEMKFHLL